MTVTELIEALSALPGDYEVVAREVWPGCRDVDISPVQELDVWEDRKEVFIEGRS